MLNIKTLEQFYIKHDGEYSNLMTFTSDNVIQFNDERIIVKTGIHKRKKDSCYYMFSYNELEKWSMNFEHYLPNFTTLLSLFNDIK